MKLIFLLAFIYSMQAYYVGEGDLLSGIQAQVMSRSIHTY